MPWKLQHHQPRSSTAVCSRRGVDSSSPGGAMQQQSEREDALVAPSAFALARCNHHQHWTWMITTSSPSGSGPRARTSCPRCSTSCAGCGRAPSRAPRTQAHARGALFSLPAPNGRARGGRRAPLTYSFGQQRGAWGGQGQRGGRDAGGDAEGAVQSEARGAEV